MLGWAGFPCMETQHIPVSSYMTAEVYPCLHENSRKVVYPILSSHISVAMARLVSWIRGEGEGGGGNTFNS